MDEDDIGIAAAPNVERLTGAERYDANLDPGFLLEDRQQEPEQPGLLGRGRRGDGDELVLRLCRERDQSDEQGNERTTGNYHGSSPSRNFAASGEAGCLRKRSAGARSTSRP